MLSAVFFSIVGAFLRTARRPTAEFLHEAQADRLGKPADAEVRRSRVRQGPGRGFSVHGPKASAVPGAQRRSGGSAFR